MEDTPVELMDIYEKINAGVYDGPYPHQGGAAFNFFDDALAEVGLTGHPKANEIYAYAWQEGHSAGLQEVLNILQELAGLFRPSSGLYEDREILPEDLREFQRYLGYLQPVDRSAIIALVTAMARVAAS